MDPNRVPLGLLGSRHYPRCPDPRDVSVSIPRDIIVTRVQGNESPQLSHRNVIHGLNHLFEEQIQSGHLSEEDKLLLKEVNLREDVGLSDQDLLTISTKDLNKLLKKLNVDKNRAKDIKRERRTLKNRGYASNCRVKRDDEKVELEDELTTYEQRIWRERVLLESMKQKLANLEATEAALDRDIEKLRVEEGIVLT
eukprot:maker-scaffold931_size79642-snap-gene-0.9 protein:Tk04719 transcript:maker-scaffold931_size79642-snap-gene-0.9-mRNA-1 annotation:"transcription factor maf"